MISLSLEGFLTCRYTPSQLHELVTYATTEDPVLRVSHAWLKALQSPS